MVSNKVVKDEIIDELKKDLNNSTSTLQSEIQTLQSEIRTLQSAIQKHKQDHSSCDKTDGLK